MTNSSSLKNLSRMSTTQVLPSAASSCHEFTYRAQHEQQHHHQMCNRNQQPQCFEHFQKQNQQRQQQSNYNYCNNNNNSFEDIAIPSELHELKCDVHHRILNDVYESKSEMHHCIEDGHTHPGISSMKVDAAAGGGDRPKTMLQSTLLHSKASQTPCNNVGESKTTIHLPRKENNNGMPMGDEVKSHVTPIVQVSKTVMSALEENEFKAIKGRKILIFGGIDPYCQHCQFDKMMQMQQQRKRSQIFGGSDADNIDPMYYLNGIDGCGTCGGVNTQVTQMDNYGDRVLYYEARTKQWKHLCYLPFGSRHHHAAVVCNGLIYIIGGTKTALGCAKKSIFEKSVWSFDPQSIKWTFECHLPELRRDFAAIVSDEFCGGEVACERCKGIKEQPKQRNGNLASGFFVIGGEGINGTALSTVWYYNIMRKTWKKKAPLNVGRYGMMAAIVNKEIWIAGGIIETKTRASDSNDGFVASPTTAADINALGAGDGVDVGIGVGGGVNGAAKGVNGSGDSFAVEATKSAVVDVITDSMEYYSLKCAYGGSDAHDEYATDELMPRDNNVGADASIAAVGADDGGGGCALSTTMKRCGAGIDGTRWIKARQHLRIPRPSENELYLVGGIGFNSDNILTSLSSVDHYNFSEGQWHHYGDIKWARHGHDITTLNDRIVIIGGVSTIKKCTLTKVESFCIKTRRNIRDLPELPWPLSGSAVLALD